MYLLNVYVVVISLITFILYKGYLLGNPKRRYTEITTQRKRNNFDIDLFEFE